MKAETDKLTLLDWISLAGATWFGSGLLPVMPGTWGTIASIPLVAILLFSLNIVGYAVAVVTIALIAIPLASRAAALYREHPRLSRLMLRAKETSGLKNDPGFIVIDEVAGYAVSLFLVQPSITAMLVAFVFFRLFDIVKIQPVKMAENLGGGIGIVLDDIVAGIYACLVTHLILWTCGLLNLPSLP